MNQNVLTVLAGATALAVLCAAPATARLQSDSGDDFAQFEAHDSQSTITIDYAAWDELMNGLVFDVGFSDRRRPSSEGTRQTGSRIQRGSRSPYRYEGNRLLAHLIDDERAEAISAYRDELAALPDSIPLSDLNKDQQLAYWLNLYTAALVSEIVEDYPVGNLAWPAPDSPRSLLNRDVVTVSGVPLGLNDIRLDIVGRYWDDPRVIYGFWHGGIGGPSLRSGAYDPSRVWSQLDRQAREFVNSLRGVEADDDVLHVSAIYFQHRRLFPDWPEDLRQHLSVHANGPVDRILSSADEGPEAIRFEWDVADLTNGTRCGGGAATSPVVTQGASGFRVSGTCGTIPPIAVPLVNRVIERRLDALRRGELGRVFVRDIPTVDPDEPRDGEFQPEESNGQTVLRRRPREDSSEATESNTDG